MYFHFTDFLDIVQLFKRVSSIVIYYCGQCWGKLHLKVMHYNIMWLPKKAIHCLVLSLWYVTFALLFLTWTRLACLFFNYVC